MLTTCLFLWKAINKKILGGSLGVIFLFPKNFLPAMQGSPLFYSCFCIFLQMKILFRQKWFKILTPFVPFEVLFFKKFQNFFWNLIQFILYSITPARFPFVAPAWVLRPYLLFMIIPFMKILNLWSFYTLPLCWKLFTCVRALEVRVFNPFFDKK